MAFNRKQLRLYFIAGTQDVVSDTSLKDILTEALEAGITLFQYREKGPGSLTGEEKVNEAKALQQLCHQYDVPFIVNDDVALAKAIDADGIHVGQDDVEVAQFAEQFEGKIIGLSVGNVEEYQQSDLSHVDYIGVGPMYTTISKADAEAPVGPEMIPELRQYVQDLPIVGIGGITTENYDQVLEAGADGISVISAITRSENVTKTVQKFLQK
ncbi:thiamine-phosphate pyrophosphorylase [Staphylococcus auricularis]|uniref:Thiamine-phosphate synthase n=1 Tax=Staphylococcus auricularis TaxID=29379 RepID=A0AAP8PQI9_9STAP|nr:thiamine phosphate synthase [Staphylococcus auricularis]MBM0869024.1 thiamine phosphate synthase [Staphylococcus auricularis]MCG7341850.1 thiamine phosphate synthase [Staphylococcus auricularis]MDC6328055.1 thiamine phosphate synthase [Staphylococcus auricularis]MDN4534185.1 thiamine phosphate synthase [Staphylococcus auricularis]PNZ69188.1 thiamine phosphate synthase [Staphylococcus auricularis]